MSACRGCHLTASGNKRVYGLIHPTNNHYTATLHIVLVCYLLASRTFCICFLIKAYSKSVVSSKTSRIIIIIMLHVTLKRPRRLIGSLLPEAWSIVLPFPSSTDWYHDLSQIHILILSCKDKYIYRSSIAIKTPTIDKVELL